MVLKKGCCFGQTDKYCDGNSYKSKKMQAINEIKNIKHNNKLH